jgi:XTP/dITP diphosphohydrolase
VLLVATGNAGKLAEFRLLLAGTEIRSPGDVGLGELDVEESGQTFHDNALLKARAHCGASGMTSVADDSGLEVDALDGRPGVRSARYGGPDLDDAGRCRRLLEELRDLPDAARTARFRCCLIICSPDGRSASVEGTCEGRILHEPAGEAGFGYDPIFHAPEYGRSMASLSRAEKGAISHRGGALRALVPILRRDFPELMGPG